MKNKDLDLKALRPLLKSLPNKLAKYAWLISFVAIAATYGFVLLRINTLSNAQPDQNEVTAQSSRANVTHIDPQLVQKLQSLKDNSVDVQALFDQARNNPFSE